MTALLDHTTAGTADVDLDFTTEPAPPATVEQLVLAAMLRAPQAEALSYLAYLDPQDFTGSHRVILDAIAAVAGQVAPAAQLVLAHLRETGHLAGDKGNANRNALRILVTVDAEPTGLRIYVHELLTTSLRRAMSEAGHAMTSAADELPTAHLWEQFQAIGRRVRDGHQARLTAFRTDHNLTD
jgi:replicative DNA helicase